MRRLVGTAALGWLVGVKEVGWMLAQSEVGGQPSRGLPDHKFAKSFRAPFFPEAMGTDTLTAIPLYRRWVVQLELQDEAIGGTELERDAHIARSDDLFTALVILCDTVVLLAIRIYLYHTRLHPASVFANPSASKFLPGPAKKPRPD